MTNDPNESKDANDALDETAYLRQQAAALQREMARLLDLLPRAAGQPRGDDPPGRHARSPLREPQDDRRARGSPNRRRRGARSDLSPGRD
jgi:hypothetical protein